MLILGSQMQEQEVGDGTNFVMILSGALLEQAEQLIRMGLTPTEIAEGYEKAQEKALELLPSLVVEEVKDIRDSAVVSKAIRAAIMAKQYGNDEFLTPLITEACGKIICFNIVIMSTYSSVYLQFRSCRRRRRST